MQIESRFSIFILSLKSSIGFTESSPTYTVKFKYFSSVDESALVIYLVKSSHDQVPPLCIRWHTTLKRSYRKKPLFLFGFCFMVKMLVVNFRKKNKDFFFFVSFNITVTVSQ